MCPTNRERGDIIRPQRNSAAAVDTSVHISLAFPSPYPHLSHCYNSLRNTRIALLLSCGVQQISPPEWTTLMIALMVISLNIGLCRGTDGQKSPAQCCAAEQMWAFGRGTIVVAQFSRSRRSRRFTKREEIIFPHHSRHNFSLANERQTPTPPHLQA